MNKGIDNKLEEKIKLDLNSIYLNIKAENFDECEKNLLIIEEILEVNQYKRMKQIKEKQFLVN